jgi:hypothetical protein
MITQIIKLVQTNEFYGVSSNVEIAKGAYQYATTWKQTFKKVKRWRKK